MEEFGAQIYVAVRSGKLKEPFNAAMAKKACPGWPEKTYHAFFSQHAIGNHEDNIWTVIIGIAISEPLGVAPQESNSPGQLRLHLGSIVP